MYVGTYFYNMGITLHRLFQYFIKLTLFKIKFVLERHNTNNVYRLIVSYGDQVPPHFLKLSQSPVHLLVPFTLPTTMYNLYDPTSR